MPGKPKMTDGILVSKMTQCRPKQVSVDVTAHDLVANILPAGNMCEGAFITGFSLAGQFQVEVNVPLLLEDGSP